MISTELKKRLQGAGYNVRVRSITGQHNGQPITWYIEARLTGGEFAEALRVEALRVIYGAEFVPREAGIAGNVRRECISMRPSEWDRVAEAGLI